MFCTCVLLPVECSTNAKLLRPTHPQLLSAELCPNSYFKKTYCLYFLGRFKQQPFWLTELQASYKPIPALLFFLSTPFEVADWFHVKGILFTNTWYFHFYCLKFVLCTKWPFPFLNMSILDLPFLQPLPSFHPLCPSAPIAPICIPVAYMCVNRFNTSSVFCIEEKVWNISFFIDENF